VLAGVLDIDASDKSARFIRFCNAFNIHSSPLSMCRDFFPEWSRSVAALFVMAPNCCLLIRPPRFPRSRLCCARPMAEPTSRCAPRAWAPIA
jgi:hypothetical protein